MKRFVVVLFFISIVCLGNAASKVGVVDLSLLVSMHPKMALFDFERLGFYRLPMGLSKDEWKKKLMQAKQISPKRQTQLMEDKRIANERLKIISEKHDKLINSPLGNGVKLKENIKKLKQLAVEENKLNSRIKEDNYQLLCPELTSLSKTRKILDKIERETLKAVIEVAKKEHFSLVLNNSVPVPYGYPVQYETSEMFGVGLPGIDTHLLYAFIANKDHMLPSDDTPDSIKMIHWLELTNYPKAQNFLPIRPYPLVLSGGIHIEKQVLTKIYSDYKISSKVIKSACSVIDAINAHRANYQKEIPIFNNIK